jgi:L-threonylcarbamoyladenylate synthase
MLSNDKKLIAVIKAGGLAVIPTDTIYGLVGSALNQKTIEKIYDLKLRDEKKPFIILISSLKDLEIFDIKLSKKDKDILKKIWPEKVSVILPCKTEKFSYLHRGTDSLAFRWPKNKDLVFLIEKTGPLATSSANPENFSPAENLTEAKKYFGKKVSVYVDGGKITAPASTLIRLKNRKIKVLRQGEIKVLSIL